jgi:hypothetical protein
MPAGPSKTLDMAAATPLNKWGERLVFTPCLRLYAVAVTPGGDMAPNSALLGKP